MIGGTVAVTLLLAASSARAEPVRLVLRERGSGAPIAGGWVEIEGRRFPAQAGEVVLDLDAGHWPIEVGSPDHDPLSLFVDVPGPAEVQVFLRPQPPPPEIVVEARRPSPHVSRHVLDRERVEQTPGAFDDPIRLIQSLPSVAITPEFGSQVGQVAIRGAAPSESRFFVDGIELPYLYHFDQYASVVPIRVLDEVAIYPSAFGAAYGDVVGAVIAARTLRPDQERAHGSVDINFIMAGGQVSVPVGDNVTVSISGRRSYLDLVESSNDQYTVWPVFYDFTSRVDWRANADHDLALIVLGAGDGYARYAGDTAALDPLEADGADVFDSDRDFQGLLLQDHLRTATVAVHNVVGLVSDRWRGSLADAAQERGELELGLRNGTTVSLGEHAVAFGLDGRFERVRLLADTDRAWPELGAEAPLLERGVALDEVRERFAGGLWVEPAVQLGPARLRPGLRAQADDQVGGGQGGLALDPRFSVQVELPADLRLRGALGRYHQGPEAETLAVAAAAGQALPGWTSATHAVLGAEVAVAGRWEIGVEGWGRWLQDAVIDDPEDGIAVVDGQALGVELTSRYRLRERFFSAASVALGQARRGGATFAYDQPYAVNLIASWDFAPGWNAGLRWRYAAGLPYTPVVDATYDGDEDRYLPIEGEPYSERLVDYQKFDLHLERDWTWRTWEVALYFELWWVPPANNTLYTVYSYDYSEQAFVVGPPLVPLLGLRAGF